MNLDDTIVAIATAPGRGGIGVVRVAGSEARAIVAPMLSLKHELVPGRAVFTELIEPSTQPEIATNHGRTAAPGRAAEQSSAALNVTSSPSRIDEVVVTYFAKPHSYTTDDIIEISAHGSPVVLRHIVELALARGARLAEPGEFTMRAFLNGRIDLTQAEAVRDLIDSQTLFQAKVAAQQLDGALSHRLQPIKHKLVALIARLEAGIDFAEDDVSILPDAVILEQIEDVQKPLTELAATFAYGKLVHEGLTLAIIGRPNVGKSSLFNRLVERERAIVTATPGTTRDLVTETVAIEGIPVKLIDTAGIRRAHDEAESIGIRKSLETLADADLVLLVLDVTQPLSQEDEELLEKVGTRPSLVVENKTDLCTQPSNDGSQPTAMGRISTSARTGEGIPALRAAILRQVSGDTGMPRQTALLTNARHQSLVTQSVAALAAAQDAVANRIPHEMLLLDLYNALRPLDEITGATTNDDILDLIFSTFCIGK